MEFFLKAGKLKSESQKQHSKSVLYQELLDMIGTHINMIPLDDEELSQRIKEDSRYVDIAQDLELYNNNSLLTSN